MDKSFSPTTEWMAEKYDEMNKKLFNGTLGKCDFAVFTTGRGSQGNTLGWFKITRRGVKINRSSGRMYYGQFYSYSVTYIDRTNFYDTCWPKIELNGNYTGTEHAFLATLVHEMCHYYTYMDGYAPKQGHGREFREIGEIVTARSNGLFTIQRLATAEEMSELELNDEMKAIKGRREENKKNSITAAFRFKTDGRVELTTTSSERLLRLITDNCDRSNVLKVVTSNDRRLIDLLFSNGYKKNLRTWRYWYVENKEWLGRLYDFDIKEYPNPKYNTGKTETSEERPKSSKKYIFSINTSKGIAYIEYNGAQEDLKDKLMQKFPNMKEEAIERIMSNKVNYKVVESRKNYNIDSIITETINDFMNDEFRKWDDGDAIDVDPSMNLGLRSPLEMESL